MYCLLTDITLLFNVTVHFGEYWDVMTVVQVMGHTF